MSFYPPKISARFHAPGNAGKTDGANASGTGAAFSCGAVLRFTLRVDREKREIREAKFQTTGCGCAIAAADALAEKITGKSLTQLHGLDKNILQKEIESELETFDRTKEHCFELAAEALQNAFADYRAARIEEWSGEKALVCTCFGVSEETIERLVRDESLGTVEEVAAACNAGGGCGSCRMLIQETIDVVWREKF